MDKTLTYKVSDTSISSDSYDKPANKVLARIFSLDYMVQQFIKGLPAHFKVRPTYLKKEMVIITLSQLLLVLLTGIIPTNSLH